MLQHRAQASCGKCALFFGRNVCRSRTERLSAPVFLCLVTIVARKAGTVMFPVLSCVWPTSEKRSLAGVGHSADFSVEFGILLVCTTSSSTPNDSHKTDDSPRLFLAHLVCLRNAHDLKSRLPSLHTVIHPLYGRLTV